MRAKKSVYINDIDVNNIIVSEILQVKQRFKFLIGYLDKNLR